LYSAFHSLLLDSEFYHTVVAQVVREYCVFLLSLRETLDNSNIVHLSLNGFPIFSSPANMATLWPDFASS